MTSAWPTAFWTAACVVTEEDVYIRPCIWAIATKLPKALPGASLDCIVLVGELCRTAYVHTTSALAHPVFGHYCCLATIEHGYNGRKTTRDWDVFSGKLYSSLMNRMHYGTWMNSTCHPGEQFQWTTVAFCPSFEGRWVTLCCSKITPDLTLHVLSWTFSVVRISRLQNGRLCHQIWLQLSIFGMKWTVVCGSVITRLACWENCEKLSVRWGRTSHRPSWPTWWHLCDGDVFLASIPGVDTLATDSANTVLGSPVLCSHQRVRQWSDIFQTCVPDHYDQYCCIKIFPLCRKLGKWWPIYECTVSFFPLVYMKTKTILRLVNLTACVRFWANVEILVKWCNEKKHYFHNQPYVA